MECKKALAGRANQARRAAACRKWQWPSALLGYKAFKSSTGTQPTPAPGGDPGVTPTEATNAKASSGGIMGGLGDLLKGPLGGILAGAAAGSAVNGGLSDLLNQFRKAGHGDAAGSWVGNGPNRPISPADLTKVLDTDQINTLMSQSGLSRDELLAGQGTQVNQRINVFQFHFSLGQTF